MMTIEKAAARYLQVADYETAIRQTEASIVDVQAELDDAADRLKELQATKRGLLKDMREAAADEAQLPLFDVRARLSVQPTGGQEATH